MPSSEKQSDVDTLAFVVACNHHERWDGKGYPGHIDVETGKPMGGHGDEPGRARGKRGDEIPIPGALRRLCLPRA